MVSVRATIESLEEAYAGDSGHGFMNDAAQLLRQLKAISTPQPHPGPIAWMVGSAMWRIKKEAKRDAAVTGIPMIPVGPMVGADEVERLSKGTAFVQGLVDCAGTQPSQRGDGLSARHPR